MARNLLTVIFLFLFVLPVYAGKPVPPTVTTEPPLSFGETGVQPVCTFFTGSADMTLSIYLGPVGGVQELVYQNLYPQSTLSFPLVYSGSVNGLTPGTQYQYQCSGSSSAGSSFGSFVYFWTVNAPLPSCTLTVNPSVITPGFSSVLSWTTTNGASLFIQGIGNVSPVSSGSLSVSPAVTTLYAGTVLNVSNQGNNCYTTLTVEPAPPMSVTVGATLLPSYNGFDFQCSYMYGRSPTRLFMRMTANGITKDYNYGTVPGVYDYTEFYPVQFTSYDLFTEVVKPSPFVPLILDLNTLYSYQCCSENSFGSSCGDTGSIYTAPYTLSFNYDYAPDWPRSVSYGAQSLWAMTINSPYVCPSVGFVYIYYLSGGTIQNVWAWDLFYSLCPSCPPSFNASSNFAMWDLNHNGFLDAGDDYNYWNSHSDAFCWDINKDGILDTINACNGRNICGVVYFQGREHFFDCPAGGVSGKPLYATAYVGGFSDSPFQMCPQVPFPFGTARAGVKAKSNAAIIRHSGVGGRGRGQGKLGMGGYEKIE